MKILEHHSRAHTLGELSVTQLVLALNQHNIAVLVNSLPWQAPYAFQVGFQAALLWHTVGTARREGCTLLLHYTWADELP
jgi:hypothetical protein